MDTHDMQSTVLLLVKDTEMKIRFSVLTSLHSSEGEETCTQDC